MLIDANNLFKSYELGGQMVHALDDLTVRIAPGKMVAICGPSGSGKSTLMNILGCLDRPDSGTYVLSGDDVSTLRDDELAEVRALRIGFVFQSFNLLPRSSALKNVELPVHYIGGMNARAKAAAALELVGLRDRMHHEPSQLSGGQRQRVAIARALVNDPAIILADEPTGALDTKTGEDLLTLLKDLNAHGRTIIIVTHDHGVARHCEREIHLRDGKIAFSDSRKTPAQPALSFGGRA